MQEVVPAPPESRRSGVKTSLENVYQSELHQMMCVEPVLMLRHWSDTIPLHSHSVLAVLLISIMKVVQSIHQLTPILVL